MTKMKVIDPLLVGTFSGHTMAEWQALEEKVRQLSERNARLERALAIFKRREVIRKEIENSEHGTRH